MEKVVLVDKDNNQIGTAPKATVHTKNTPLHRGFSLFVFNSKKQLLLTKRANSKKAFPGVWTNTVCGHPGPSESPVEAAKRRLRDELGMIATNIQLISDYRYCFSDNNGIVENEVCPILFGLSNSDPRPNKNEVESWEWVDFKKVLRDMRKNASKYSPWSREEAKIIYAKRFALF